MVRQLSIDQFENEGRRVSHGTPESAIAARRLLDRQMSINSVPKKVIGHLLKPRDWKPPVQRQFFLICNEIADLCDSVMEFCNNNDLQLNLSTLDCFLNFTNSLCAGTANNAGAILVLGRDLVVVPKLIHPLPPAINSPEASPERHTEDSWIKELNANRPPTPTRGRPQTSTDRGSLAWM
ncbi:hypothetical protein ZIOFF_029180 [Zingiber officinale]|uniref:Uncharacterized protein n=1 Tax=Zingiber officinale TaxID=94328 RepID=A0A8J5H7S1_ZINOF|nr:hypothetical protein ZIOFF_029180 [Zingiber officinale]